MLSERQKYYDMERNKTYDFPPPRNTPRSYIEAEHHSHIRSQDKWADDNTNVSMPNWMMDILEIDTPLQKISILAQMSLSMT